MFWLFITSHLVIEGFLSLCVLIFPHVSCYVLTLMFPASPPLHCVSLSNGPWLSFRPPLPFHFLITSPLPSLTGAQTRLPLCYSTFRSVPHFLAALRSDPTAAGNGYLQHSFLSSALSPAPCHCPYERARLQQVVSSTLSALRQLLSLLLTSSGPSITGCSSLTGPLLCYPQS